MVLIPEIHPRSFLFFFEKGNSGLSYSLRDYSEPHCVKERYAREFGWTAEEIRQKAVHVYDAPYLDVKRLWDWHLYTIELNRQHGIPVLARIGQQQEMKQTGTEARFRLLNQDLFDTLPKAAKAADMRRILRSAQSEDWVTWNLLNLLMLSKPDSWWKDLAGRAGAVNPILAPILAPAPPRMGFWQSVRAPQEYETLSRKRMRLSTDPLVTARSLDPRPVEGRSEIDVVIDSNSFLIYVEAKLGSDISMRTTYDPERNQIVRNIDCLLGAAGGRTPLFWMFVRDASPSRAYTQMIEEYRMNPETLTRALPHRDPAKLRQVARSLILLTWRQIGMEACALEKNDDDLLVSIKNELSRRIK